MSVQKKKSKKQSGTNSLPPKLSLVLFLDENTTSRLVREALQAAGFVVEIHRDHFSPGTSDAEWLQVVAKRKWIVITRDRRIRYRPNEVAAVRASGARVVFVTGGNMSSEDLAALLTTHSKKLVKFIALHRKSFMAILTKGGGLSKIE